MRRVEKKGERARRALSIPLGAALACAALAWAAACGDSSPRGQTALQSATVERLAGGALEVAWTTRRAVPRVEVFASTDPDAHGERVAIVEGESSTVLDGLDPTRRYYLRLEDGSDGLQAAERRVPITGAPNFRDLGGYATAGGHRTRWGKVFRSDDLSRLTDADLDVFGKLGLRLLCDFRSPSEVDKAPDRLPAEGAPEVLHLPIYDPQNDVEAQITTAITTRDFAAQEALLGDGRAEQILIGAGRVLVTDSREQYTSCLRRLADPASLPTLTHCTAGKDRTGFSSALILLALGVPEDVVMQDYLLSNTYRAERNEQTIASVRPLMQNPDLLRPLLEVRAIYLQTSFDTIHEQYGSVERYVRDGLGIDDQTVRRLRDNLLD